MERKTKVGKTLLDVKYPKNKVIKMQINRKVLN